MTNPAQDACLPSADVRRPRIVFIWVGVHRVGGVETFLRQCLTLLPARGLDPVVLDLPARNTRHAHEDMGMAPSYGGNLQTISKSSMPSIVTLTQGAWESRLGYERRVFDRLAQLQPHAVVFCDWAGAWLIPTLSAGLPVIALFHSDNDNPGYYSPVEKIAPRLAAMVGVSPRIAGRLRTLAGAGHAPRVSHIPCGAPLPPAVNSPTLAGGAPIRLVYFGRLVQAAKRVDDLVPFVHALSQLQTPFVLTILGEGDRAQPLREALAEPIRDGRVRMCGPQPHDQVLREIARQDIYLLFSEYEGLPLTLLESLAAGLVPVVTRVPSGVSEVLEEGKTARFFPIGDADRAAHIVADLARDPDQWARLRAAGLRLAREFTLEAMGDRYAQLFGQVTAGVEAQTLWQAARFTPRADLRGAKSIMYRIPDGVLRVALPAYRALRYGPGAPTLRDMPDFE